MDVIPPAPRPLARRRLLTAGIGGLGVAGAAGAAAAVTMASRRPAAAGGPADRGTITIGLVTPLTGPLAGFAAGDRFVAGTVRATAAYARGFRAGGRIHRVSIVVADSRSDPNWAAQAARLLIMNHRADMILATSAPETTNPVADVCQSQGVPCLSTVVPWEAWYTSLGGNPARPASGFQYCAMFWFGLREYRGCFAPMWDRAQAGRDVACLYPGDADGNLFRASFEPLIRQSGYTPVDGGGYLDGTAGYSPVISRFRAAGCGLLSAAPRPADFGAFWRQAAAQGFRPRLATVAKVLQLPAEAAALGPLARNIATASWWGPSRPARSSLDGMTAGALASAYQARSGQPWLQTLGSTYSLFEVAREAFTAVSDPHDKAAVAAALHQVSYTGMCGPLDFASGPAPGVAVIKPVGAQWRAASGRFPFELTVVDNSLDPAVPAASGLELTGA